MRGPAGPGVPHPAPFQHRPGVLGVRCEAGEHRRPRVWRRCGSWCLLLALGWLAAAPAALAQTLDRILAVVSGHVITASDVRGFPDPRAERHRPRGEVDAERRVLERLIDRPPGARRGRPPADRGSAPGACGGGPRGAGRAFPRPGRRSTMFARPQRACRSDDLRQILRDEARRESYLRDRFGPRRAGGGRPAGVLRATHVEEFAGGRRRRELRGGAPGRAAAADRELRDDAEIEDWGGGAPEASPDRAIRLADTPGRPSARGAPRRLLSDASGGGQGQQDLHHVEPGVAHHWRDGAAADQVHGAPGGSQQPRHVWRRPSLGSGGPTQTRWRRSRARASRRPDVARSAGG